MDLVITWMLLIGSRALQRAWDIRLPRLPVDYDYISTYGQFHAWVEQTKQANMLNSCIPLTSKNFVVTWKIPNMIFEFEIAWPGSSGAKLLEITDSVVGSKVAGLDVCLALKLSHRYLRNSPAFRKTMDDIWLLRNAGVIVGPELADWQRMREAMTYDYSHPRLNQTKSAFFDKSVVYTYDHDSVHRAVAVECHPAYTFYKSDDAEVQCSRAKFDALPLQTRLNGVLEEAYVLAIERSLVPHPGALTPRQAFLTALMKVCTSITSGWFREFAWEHYYQVLAHYDENYVTKFNNAVNAGEVPLAVN